jgi:hypothetical protein
MSRRFLAILFAIAVIFSVYIPTQAQQQSGLGQPNPNGFTFSLADLQGIQSTGDLYDPRIGRITWKPGTRAEELFTVGTFDYPLDQLSLDNLANNAGASIDTTPLSAFPVINQLTIQDFVDLIPPLANTPLTQVQPFADLARQQGITPRPGATIGSISPFVSAALGEVTSQLTSTATRYVFRQIPGLSNLKLGKIPGLNFAKIQDIPYLKYFPLINPLTLKDYFVKYDIGYGMSSCSVSADCSERNIDNTASGNLENTNIPCMGANQSCAHIEVIRNGPLPHLFNRWVSKEQRVPGGNGFLCGTEPTGRFPFGRNPKLVIEKIDERAGEITLALYFSIPAPPPLDLESAHCIGPIPLPIFGTAKEGGWVLFGADSLPTNMPPSAPGGMPMTSGGGGGGGPQQPMQELAPPVSCDGQKRKYMRPTNGPATSEFGWRIHPIYRVPRLHAGIDLGSGTGTPIAAADCGVVVHASSMGGYGLTVDLLHPDQRRTRYAHMSAIAVKDGDQVKRGTLLGRVGSTGNSTGPHLHFEVMIGGKPVNPRPYTEGL